MQKSSLVDEIPQREISLTVDWSVSDFLVLDRTSEVSISCISEVSPGMCIDLCGEFPRSERSISVSVSGETVYGIIEALAAEFTTVVYGFIRSICRKAERIADTFRRMKLLPVRCRMAQLSFAGGLRL